jgi:hypothetical protein
MDQPPYSPKPEPNSFDFFELLKIYLAGQLFAVDADVR